MSEENKIKAQAVMDFVNLLIGAYDAGFVNKNNPDFLEIYACAKNWCSDEFSVEFDEFSKVWSEECQKYHMRIRKERSLNQDKYKQMEQAMTEFVERVDRCEVRSVKTYNKFKEILSISVDS